MHKDGVSIEDALQKLSDRIRVIEHQQFAARLFNLEIVNKLHDASGRSGQEIATDITKSIQKKVETSPNQMNEVDFIFLKKTVKEYLAVNASAQILAFPERD